MRSFDGPEAPPSQELRSSGAQELRSSGAQELSSSGAQQLSKKARLRSGGPARGCGVTLIDRLCSGTKVIEIQAHPSLKARAR